MSLTSHAGTWENGDWRFGWERFGGWNELIAVNADPRYDILPPAQSLLHVGPDHVVLSALKMAHDSEDLIVRVYDPKGCQSNMTIGLLAPFIAFRPYEIGLHRLSGAPLPHRTLAPLVPVEAWQTNMLEDREQQVPVRQLAEAVELAPHEIKTLRLQLPVITRGDVDAELGERTVYRHEKGGLVEQGVLTDGTTYLGVG